MTVIEIDKSCDELHKGGVYNYTASPDFLQRGDCEHSWKSHDGTVLDYGNFLVRDYCESGIRYTVRCLNPSNETQYFFNVSNSTTETHVYGNDNTTSIAVLVVVVLIAVLIGVLFFKNPRWRDGVRDWWQRLVRSCRPRADEDQPLELIGKCLFISVNPGDVRANGCVNGEEAQALKDNVTTVDESRVSESE